MRSPQQWRAMREQLPLLLLLAVVFVWVLPALEERDPIDGHPLGLAIRGYGVFLLLGVVSATLLAVYRARRVGVKEEVIFSLTVWLFVGGIIGARVFYVVEYWREFQRPSLLDTIVAILKFTEGGLVIYGAALGGLTAGAVYVRSRGLAVLAMADLIAPSLALGLAFGRLGCLMTGCCYAGVCDPPWPGLQFPFGSPAYIKQLEDGTLWGFVLKKESEGVQRVISVRPGSPAALRGIQPGDTISSYRATAFAEVYRMYRDEQSTQPIAVVQWPDGRQTVWTVGDLPRRTMPVHPVQLYASVDAFLLCLLTWFLYPIRPRDGVVFAVLFTLYPISRFLQEIIRVDEPGQFGTVLSISQWISLTILGATGILWLYLVRSPKHLSFAAEAAGKN